ncbi:hypothetical protein F5B17DRAFT_107198 [Nemania serpens]|nr:hypothetical protein F5B17DRAFT_107198 [Nemania serpens]
MKYTIAALAFAAAAVSAQSLSDIPQCALPCIDDARTKNTSCAADDFKCICDNVNTLTTAATSCVLGACGADAAVNEVIPAVQKFCADVESGGGSSASTSGPTSQPTSESTSESASESTSASTSEPTSEVTSELTSQSTAGSTSAATITSQSSYPGTTTTPTYVGGNATATASATSTIPTAGAAIASYMGGLAMAILGALAAF